MSLYNRFRLLGCLRVMNLIANSRRASLYFCLGTVSAAGVYRTRFNRNQSIINTSRRFADAQRGHGSTELQLALELQLIL